MVVSDSVAYNKTKVLSNKMSLVVQLASCKFYIVKRLFCLNTCGTAAVVAPTGGGAGSSELNCSSHRQTLGFLPDASHAPCCVRLASCRRREQAHRSLSAVAIRQTVRKKMRLIDKRQLETSWPQQCSNGRELYSRNWLLYYLVILPLHY